jgi:E3 ubiquitin-protein ligase listerin
MQSVRVRMGYTEHLRTLGIVSKTFIPNILGILDLYNGLYSGPPKAFKLDIWAVDEFHLEG